MSHYPAAKTYPKEVFKNPGDETQELSKEPKFCTLIKDVHTRSEIYSRMFPDNSTSALCFDGPATGTSSPHIVLNSLGQVKVVTGEKTDGSATSGMLQVHTMGQFQKHNERSQIEYNCGQDEDKFALNIKAYGKVLEETVGYQRTIKATKIVIEADDLVLIKGQQINIESGGKMILAGTQIKTVQVNREDTIFGQKMTRGAGEDTKMTFDPRATVNVVSPGHIQNRVLGDIKIECLGCVDMHALGGSNPRPVIKNRSVGFAISTKTNMELGGTVSTLVAGTNLDLKGTAGVTMESKTGLVDITGQDAGITATAGEAYIDGKTAVVQGTTSVEVKTSGGANIKLQGALIYLN